MTQPEQEQPQKRDLKEFNELRTKSDRGPAPGDRREDLSVIGIEGELAEPIPPTTDWHEELAEAQDASEDDDTGA